MIFRTGFSLTILVIFFSAVTAQSQDSLNFELTEQSTASFSINEVLLGNNKTVVGTSSDVQGNFSVDLNDLSSLQMQRLEVNAKDFTTDNRRRNASLHNRILDTEAYPSILFEFSSIEEIAELEGGSVTALIKGLVTIKEVVREESFIVRLNKLSDSELQGSASTTILYENYGLNIPPVPMVASVEDEVILTIDFFAVATTPKATTKFEGFPVLVLGEQLYQANCVACHGQFGEGYANDAMPAPAVNGSEHAWHHPDEQILGLIANGGPNMPAIGATWTQEEREAVWIYVKHWWAEDLRQMQPGELGEALLAEFENKE